MYDLIIEVSHTVWRNGFSLTALGTAVFVLLKQRKVKKRIKKFIPWLMEDDSEVKAYVGNQLEIKHNLSRLLAERGLEWESNLPQPISKPAMTPRIRSYFSFSQGGTNQVKPRRRMTRMRNYLKKLGRTKFQALLASLIVNGASAYLFLSGTLDIDGQLNTWMPIINMTVATISTWVYILVEGGIDKARAEGSNQNEIHTSDPGAAE